MLEDELAASTKPHLMPRLCGVTQFLGKIMAQSGCFACLVLVQMAWSQCLSTFKTSLARCADQKQAYLLQMDASWIS